jgi:two-component system NtrC family sensor kinase
MFHSTRLKIVVSFLAVSLLGGTVSLLVGTRLLYTSVLNEARMRVGLDLNAAREIYNHRLQEIRTTLAVLSQDPSTASAFRAGEIDRIHSRLEIAGKAAGLNFAGISSPAGAPLRKSIRANHKDGLPSVLNPAVELALSRKAPVYGTAVLSPEYLRFEDQNLADRARIAAVATPRAASREEKEEGSGLALAGAAPVFLDGELVCLLYGGVLLNRDVTLVDTIRDTVFQNETYKGRHIGTATIFFEDLRISTNVLTPEGKRAIGTRISAEVKTAVLDEGRKWTDRAFVVNDWYLTAYEPIVDIRGKRVGILYVGILEEKYGDIGRNAFTIFIALTFLGMGISVGLGLFLASRIMEPVYQLIEASKQVSAGNLSPPIDLDRAPKSEMGILQKTFQEMLASVRERYRRQKAESEIQLLQSEKQASIGRLAAGVAHEINNPLTGVLTFSHLLLRRKDLPEDVRKDLGTIVQATERVRKIIKGLLDFSRQTALYPEPLNLHNLVRSTIALVENQALVKGIRLQFEPGEALPPVTVDGSQIQSVLLNIILNALDATEPGGDVTLVIRLQAAAETEGPEGVEIRISDTGCGIPPENITKLFDPFFSTKEVGRGTGLGLSVSLGIVERHGGAIRVQSEVGKGSTFTIWLPLEGKKG